MTGLTLFQIENSVRELLAMEGEVSQDVINDTLESLGLQEKLRAYVAVALELEASALARRGLIDSIKKRAEQEEERAVYLRERALEAMVLAGWKKLDCGEFTLGVQATKGRVVVEDESAIPPQFLRFIPAKMEIDKAKISAAGGCPGAAVVPGVSLRVR